MHVFTDAGYQSIGVVANWYPLAVIPNNPDRTFGLTELDQNMPNDSWFHLLHSVGSSRRLSQLMVQRTSSEATEQM